MANSIEAEKRAGWALVSPPFLYTLLALAVPFIVIVGLSFAGLEGGRARVPLAPGDAEKLYFTFENFARVLSEPIYRVVLLRSLIIAVCVTLATVLMAYPIAYFVSFYVAPSKKALWIFLITIPFWTSYIIRLALWRTILGYNGIFDNFVGIFGIEPMNLLSNGALAITITLSHAFAPFAVLPIFVALEKVDRSLLEAGQDLGETRWTTFLRVTLPLSMPGVMAAVLIVFIPVVGDYVTAKLMGGSTTPMIANLVEVEMLKKRDHAMGSAVAVTAMATVAVISILFVLLNRRFIGSKK
ncbi:ABC transporter permease [Pseudogemmobacter blasticus]|uniref:ABC transporter permease n=1 Tax=Fuscovulum blasticum DSM 2131 TaxID=1188250 RepID=A0A2T4JB00_FUSBL|nr:ABC transporter permease [Fuscovulum blasticum]PTE15069.1 ABC transporter permease [Fuscovulum blasticum DSM 2131]